MPANPTPIMLKFLCYIENNPGTSLIKKGDPYIKAVREGWVREGKKGVDGYPKYWITKSGHAILRHGNEISWAPSEAVIDAASARAMHAYHSTHTSESAQWRAVARAVLEKSGEA